MSQKKTSGNIRPIFNEYLILGVFAVVALSLLACGAIFGWSEAKIAERSQKPPAEVIAAPAMTSADYEREVSDVMTPFLELAAEFKQENFAADSAPMLELVTKTQERLLNVDRVPADHRTPHLSFVLLLDQWKRALSGSVLDQKTVIEKTETTVRENPWITRK